MSAGGKDEPEPVLSIIFVFMIFGFIGWIIWHFFKIPILEVLRWVRFGELWILNLFVHHYDPCLSWLTHARFGETTPSSDMVQWTNGCFGAAYLAGLPPEQSTAYYSLSAPPINALETEIISYYRWPMALFLLGVGFYMIFLTPRNKFKTHYTLESFIKAQAKMWPVIAPIVNFNPSKFSARIPGTPVPDKVPPFAESFSPEEWISWHRIPVTNGIPEREATRRAFLMQLGPRWTGIEDLPHHLQGLVAAYALKGAQKREESDDLLSQLSTCWSHTRGFKMKSKIADDVRRVLKNPELSGKVLAVGNQHAYRATAMVGILLWARSLGGVLAPAQFLWLRGTDRSLWYALNNAGRRSFHTEGAGALAHFMAEMNAKKPLPIPRIDTAIVTLNQYLAERGSAIPPREEPAH